jgi:hypothetical protein
VAGADQLWNAVDKGGIRRSLTDNQDDPWAGEKSF